MLFHGPGARGEAERTLPQIGRRIAEPFGLEGLKIDEARDIISLMQSAQVGDQPGCVLVGPLDEARQAATDVLLKVVEEFDPEAVRPVLWAHDLGSVSQTIVSRCVHRWCPKGTSSVNEDSMKLAFDLVDATLRKDRARVIEMLRNVKSEGFADLVEATTRVLAMAPEQLTGNRFVLWERVRKLALYRHMGKTEVLAVFAGG